ncbi:MAG: ATP-binding protein [Planctomycetaceae bacterium]|nr:ATP-binding protein [Planctomycetaceae bacterium]
MIGPDSITPWFFESTGHVEAVNRLLYLVEQRESSGLLTGPQGSGKTRVLQKLAAELQSSGLQAVSLNLAGATEESALFQLAERMSEQARPAMSRHELMSSLRAEFQGRSQCGLTTQILLDDVHLADFSKETFLRFLISIARMTRGVTVIAAGTDSLPEILSQTVSFPVSLERLDAVEASDFLRQLLPRLGCSYSVCEEAGVRAAVEMCRGRMQTLCRLAEVMAVFHRAWPTALITTATVRQLAREINLAPQEDLLNRRVLKLA